MRPDPARRRARVEHLLVREINALLQTELQDPWLQSVTVTAVVLSNDKQSARVFFTTLTDEHRAETAAALNGAAAHIRTLLYHGLSLRSVPELHFVPDEMLAQADRLERLLRQLEAEDAARGRH